MSKQQIGSVGLGDLVRDVVSGFTGIVVCKSLWLNGCFRIIVQPQDLKDGKPIENQCFDDNQLEILEAAKVACTNRDVPFDQVPQGPKKGGPQNDVTTQPGVGVAAVTGRALMGPR